MTRILAQKNYSVFQLPGSAIDNDTSFNEWVMLIMDDLNSQRNIVISGPVELIKDKLQIKEITHKLVIAAKMIIEKCSSNCQLFIEGGETASLFFRVVGWTELKVDYAWNEGVVLLGYKDSDIRVFIKPGSYKWPEKIFMYISL